MSGITPWPRLKMCPGRPPVRPREHLERPWPPRPATAHRHDGRVEVALHRVWLPSRRRASARSTRQSTPTTSAPASAIAPSSSPVPTPKWMRGTPRSARPRQDLGAVGQDVAAVVGGTAAGRPTSRTAARPDAPATTCDRRDAMARSARRSSRASQRPASPYISRLVARPGPRRTALDQVAGHGERCAGEADQRHGRAPWRGSARSRARTACRPPGRAAGAGRGRRRVRNGWATTGPVPGATSTPKPMAATGTTMSE